VLENLKYNDDKREKKAFYAGDYGKLALDLYFGFVGEKPTNPPKWNDTLKWGAGRGVEEQMGIILKQNGIIPQDYDQKTHGRVEMERYGVKIHGYIDYKTMDGTPVECKSINNANEWDIKSYSQGYPRESYVGQLATYLESTGRDLGHLFVASVDGLSTFWFDCKKVAPGVYKCGNVTVDIDKEYKRWAKIYNDNVLTKTLPDIWEKRYKYDVATLDWKSISPSKISKARNGHAVIGDWEISWSPWKDKIIELQGTTLGYTNEELSIILEKTEGYTTWKKKAK
jgi:hypothetical protein